MVRRGTEILGHGHKMSWSGQVMRKNFIYHLFFLGLQDMGPHLSAYLVQKNRMIVVFVFIDESH